MEYAYKPTTHGLAVMAACMALEKPLKITRVAFGSGKVEGDVNLADVHELLAYVSDGAVAERRHEDSRFLLTIQYANSEHTEVKTFLLSEFIVYVEDPETGEETDLIYGSLGDYRQPVPAYNPAFPPSVFNFPLTVVLSDEIRPIVSAPAGLVTHDELNRALEGLTAGTREEVKTIVLKEVEREILVHGEDKEAHQDIRQAVQELREKIGGGVIRAQRLELAIPATGWEPDEEYPYRRDIPRAEIAEDLTPILTILPATQAAAGKCGLCPAARTLPGVLRVYAQSVPEDEIRASLLLLGDVRGLEEITIPTTGWEPDGGEFPLRLDLASERAARDLTPLLTVLPASTEAAEACGLSPSAETLDGVLRIWARSVPAVPLQAQLALLGAVQYSSSGSTLPAATADTLGGVKVRPGSGLKVDGGGNLAVDFAGDSAVSELFSDSKA